jgi:cell filamentation protein
VIGDIKGLDGLDKEGIIYANLNNPDIQQLYKSYRTQPIK